MRCIVIRCNYKLGSRFRGNDGVGQLAQPQIYALCNGCNITQRLPHMISDILRIVFGICFGLASGWVLSPALLLISAQSFSVTVIFYLLTALGVGALCYSARGLRAALGRGFLVLGVCCFTVPVSTFFLSWIFTNEMVAAQPYSNQSYMAVGAGLGAAIMVAISAVLAFGFGGLFLLVGFVLVKFGKGEGKASP